MHADRWHDGDFILATAMQPLPSRACRKPVSGAQVSSGKVCLTVSLASYGGDRLPRIVPKALIFAKLPESWQAPDANRDLL